MVLESLLGQSVILLSSLIALAYASKFMLKYSIEIANATRLGELVFGFIILSLLTNLPELSLAVTSVITGNENISIGNLVGGSVYNITFVIGLMALIVVIKIKKESLKELSKLLFFVAAIPLLVIIADIPIRIFGGLLVLFYVWFVWISTKGKWNLKELRTKRFRERLKINDVFGFFTSTAFVLGTAIIAVKSAANISNMLGIAQTVIGASIVGVSTNLPELTIAVRSAFSRHENLGIGNVLGSNLTGVALILGLIFILSPTIALDITEYAIIALYLVGSSLLLWIFVGRGKIEKMEGILLIILFIIFILVNFGFSFEQLKI